MWAAHTQGCVAVREGALPSCRIGGGVTGDCTRAALDPAGLCGQPGGITLANTPSSLGSFVTRQEFLDVEQELEEVREELKCLRWKVRHIGETVQPLAEESKRYNGYTLLELKAMAQCEQDPCQAAHRILTALFSDVYLLQHSGPELACNARAPPPPKLDPELYTVYCEILQSIFPGLSSQALREGVRKAGP